MDIFATRSGSNQNEAPKYKIVKLYYKQNEQAEEQANEQADEQAEEQANEHINKQNINKLKQTKINNLFLYLINKDKRKISEEIDEGQTEGIINILKKLDIYIDNIKALKYLDNENLQDYKNQYWSIKELYISSYGVFLQKLDRNQFLFKYKEAKKNTIKKGKTNEDLINYFIRSLQNLLKGKDENEHKR